MLILSVRVNDGPDVGYPQWHRFPHSGSRFEESWCHQCIESISSPRSTVSCQPRFNCSSFSLSMSPNPVLSANTCVKYHHRWAVSALPLGHGCLLVLPLSFRPSWMWLILCSCPLWEDLSYMKSRTRESSTLSPVTLPGGRRSIVFIFLLNTKYKDTHLKTFL